MTKNILIIASVFFAFSCSEPTVENKTETETNIEATVELTDDEKIQAYLKAHNYDAKPTGSGLYILIENEGSEEKPNLNSLLTLNYKGYFLNGESFDGTGGTPTTFPFPVSQLIAGWQEGIPSFGKGGKGKLFVPSNLGYGDRDSGPIPGGSVLIFDMEIIDFKGEPLEAPLNQ